MSASGENLRADDRLLTFELAGDFYAIPIAGVLEVADAGRVTCIPTLPTSVGGVINYHGDALPVLNCSSLFDVTESELAEPGIILVIAGRVGESARLGIPVDRVLGLVDGAAAAMPGAKAVAERRSIQGRVASVLDPQRLVSQARNVIESSLGRRV
ncbi:MAG: chemotaxis protein CheW [Myxococcales bacterium]|nr:chemotaxis protein CheW [Myxococcales bacterium]